MNKLLAPGFFILFAAALTGWIVLRAHAPESDSPITFTELGRGPGPQIGAEQDHSADRFGIRGSIGYAVRGPDGRIKAQGVVHNTVNNEAKNDVFNRIAATGSVGAFDAIAALSVPVSSDDPANGVLASSLALNLDGKSATSGNQNPAEGTVATDFGADPGRGSITVTFTAKADSVTVRQIVLTKAGENDTVAAGGVAIADADIFAYVDVPDVSLNTDDTVQYTWTVNVD